MEKCRHIRVTTQWDAKDVERYLRQGYSKCVTKEKRLKPATEDAFDFSSQAAQAQYEVRTPSKSPRRIDSRIRKICGKICEEQNNTMVGTKVERITWPQLFSPTSLDMGACFSSSGDDYPVRSSAAQPTQIQPYSTTSPMVPPPSTTTPATTTNVAQYRTNTGWNDPPTSLFDGKQRKD